MLAVGEHLGLVRQIRPARIDQINARQPVLGRDLLGAQMLLDRDRIIRAALDRRVVGDDHDLTAGNDADAGNKPGAVHVALVHAEGGKRADFQERRTRIDQAGDAFAGQKLAAGDVTFARLARTALGGDAPAEVEFVDQSTPFGRVGCAIACPRSQGALNPRHRVRSPRSQLTTLRQAPALLSLFTRDIAGKAIADLIISFRECLASARACAMLPICNI